MVTSSAHRCIPALAAIAIVVLFFSCNRNEKETLAAFRMMEESMEVSNRIISTNTGVVLASID